MAKAQTASFEDLPWGKILAVLGALAAFGFLPKKYGTPIAVAGLVVAIVSD